MAYLKKITQGNSFTHLLLYFNTISVLALALVLLWKNAGYAERFANPQVKNIEVYCPIQLTTCTIDTPQGPIELSVDQAIKPLVSSSVHLRVTNPHLASAKIRFEGLDDYMGINQFRFKPTSTDQSQWRTQISIPICTIESKTWRVTLNLQNVDSRQIYSYWFKLKIT